MITVKLEEGVKLPELKSEDAVGFDVTANSILAVYTGDQAVPGEQLARIQEGFKERGYIKIRKFERILFGTGIHVAAMEDYMELQVRPRSGMTLKQGLTVLNSPGTVDPDYRGEIGIILYNSSPSMTTINKGARIAQLVPKSVIRPEFRIGEVVKTKRGAGAYGSTDN